MSEWTYCFHCKRAIVRPEDAMLGARDVNAVVHVGCHAAHMAWSDEWNREFDRLNPRPDWAVAVFFGIVGLFLLVAFLVAWRWGV